MTNRAKKMTMAELKVGIFVAAGLAIFLFFIINVTWGGKLFKFGEDRFVAKTYLPSVEGLKEGAPVWLAGMEIGSVVSVSPVPYDVYEGNKEILAEIKRIKGELDALERMDQRDPGVKERIADLRDKIRELKANLRNVEVVMRIEKRYQDRISVDSEVSIGSRGLIGDSYIEISVGSFGVPPETRADPRYGRVVILSGVRTTGFREIITGANDVVANFGVLSEQIKEIAKQIDPKRTGRSISQIADGLERTIESANRTFDEATNLVLDMRRGEGTFSKIVNDPSLYDNLSSSVKNLNDVTAKIKDGNGTLARFVNDPGLYNKANSLLGKTDSVMARIERGEGTLGKLTKDEALYERTRQTLEKVSSFVDRIERGEGTLGKLAHDQTLYNNLNVVASELAKLIYDIRKDPKKFLTIRFRLF